MNAIAAEDFLEGVTTLGASLVTGVPCSYLAGPIRLLELGWLQGKLPYVPAVNEGSALAIAAGASASGGLGVVLSQNSGFGNLVNPLTSLVLPYRLPVIVVLTMRAWPLAEAGEEQHFWMGKVVPEWLKSLDIPFWHLTGGQTWPAVVSDMQEALRSDNPVFLLVGKGAVGNDSGARSVSAADGLTRKQMLDALAKEAPGAHILSTTGYISRELFHHADRPLNFYMQGSMGHVISVGLGAALSQSRHRFVVLDGDGAAFMHLGVLATIGQLAPDNIVHIVFDNGSYESTGGQSTGFDRADLAGIALACGYRSGVRARTVPELDRAIAAAMGGPGPSMIVVQGRMSAVPGGRASSEITPPAIARRFRGTFAANARPGQLYVH